MGFLMHNAFMAKTPEDATYCQRLAKARRHAGFETRVDAVNATANTLVVLGVQIDVDANTRREDRSDARVSPFNLSHIAVGDYVEVRGQELPANSNRVLASRLERERPDTEIRLRGVADSVARPAVTILGVAVQTNSSTQYRDTTDAPMTADAFFATAQGRTIAAKSSVNSGVFVARELEVETD